MKYIFALICAVFVGNISDDRIVVRLPAKAELFACDHIDNVYVYSNQTLLKYNQKGILENQTSFNVYGVLTSIDVSDPMGILLFFNDFNTVLVADNKLNIIGQPIDLYKSGYSSVDAVCKSKQFGFWIFDGFRKKLILHQFSNLKVLKEIDFLKNQAKPDRVIQMAESGNQIYLLTNENRVFVAHQLGGAIKLLDIKPQTGFQVKNDWLCFTDKKSLIRYNLSENKSDTLQIKGFDGFDDIRLGNQKMFIIRANQLNIIPSE
jgi:hypothetical protein